MNNHVTVFAVDREGRTGDALGHAVLVAPRLVLAAPELAAHLRERPDAAARAAVATDRGVDVVDVDEVHHVTDDLVALELVRPLAIAAHRITPVTAPAAELATDDARRAFTASATALAAGLAGRPEAPVDPDDDAGTAWPPESGDDPFDDSVWCRWLGIHCPKLEVD